MNAARDRRSNPPGAEGTYARERDFSRAEAARYVLADLASWRGRIAETQTLLRLALSFLQGPPAGEPGALSPDERTERCVQLARLTDVEARALARLELPDLGLLRGSSGVRESGIDLRSFDASAAERHLHVLRERAARSLGIVAARVDPRSEPSPAPSPVTGEVSLRTAAECIVSAFEHLDDLLRRAELLDAALSSRAENPSVTVVSAVERAGAARNVPTRCEGDGGAEVLQARGLLRLLAELLHDANAGGPVRVRARRAGSLLVMVLEGEHEGPGRDELEEDLDRDRHEYLRLIAYVLHGRADRVAPRTWTLTLGDT